MIIDLQCPICKKSHKLEMASEDWALYLAKGVKALPRKYNSFQREQLISNMCIECQEETFGCPAPGHEKEWGEQLGECECCGAPIWSIRNKTPIGTYQCLTCHETFTGI